MRLQQLSLLKYGVFENRTFEFGDGAVDLHLIVGPNEAGKSTLLSGVADLLFNIPERTPYGFRHGMSELAIGATLEHGGDQLALVRRKKRKDPLTTPQGEPLVEAVLYPFLGGADRETFARMFGLDQARLREGGDSFLQGAPHAARAVLEAEGGLAGLGALLADLDTQAEGLFAPTARNKPLNLKLSERKEAEQRARDQSVDERQWSALNARQAAAETLRRTLIARLAEIAGRLTTLERIRRVRPLLAALHTRQAEIAPLAGLPHLPADSEIRRAEAERLLTAGEARLQTLHEALERTEAMQQEAVDVRLIEDAEAIERLVSQRGVYEDRSRALPRRTEDLAGLAAGIAKLKADGGLTGLKDPPAKVDRERLRLAFEAAREGRAAFQRLTETEARLLQDLEAETHQLGAIATVEHLGGLRAHLEQAPRDVARQRFAAGRLLEAAANRLAQEMAWLAPWPGELAALTSAAPPIEAVIEVARSGFAQLDREVADHRRALADAEGRLTDVRAELAKLSGDGAILPTPAVLATARQARDAAWVALRARASTPARGGGDADPDAYEHLVRQADDLADRRQTEADRLAAHVVHSAEAERLADRAAAARTGLGRLANEAAAAKAAWTAQCARTGFPEAITPAEMSAWAGARTRVLEADQALTALRADTAEAAAQTDRQLLALRQALVSADGAVKIEDDADALIAQVTALVRRLEEQQLERTRVEEVVSRLRAELRRSAEAVKTETALAETRACELAEALSRCGLSPASDDIAVAAALDALDKWALELGSHDQMAERVRLVRADVVEFEAEVAGLVARLGQSADGEPGPTLQRLSEALREAQAVQARARHAAQEAAGIGQEIAALREDLAIARADLADLAALAGVDDPSRLAELIGQAQARDDLQSDIDRLRREIDEAGDGRAVEGLQEDVAALEPEALAAEISALEAERQDLGDQRDAASAELAEATRQVALHASGSDAAAALQDAEDARAEASTQAERYVEARSVGALLRWAIARHRKTRAAPLIARASEIMATITAGDFVGLELDFEQGDEPVVVGRRHSGERLASPIMSEGTRDQLYLALRLAAVEERAVRHALPFIADDLLVNGDDERCAAIFDALAHLARSTQVLCFTHHEHLVPIAEHALGTRGYHLHRMTKPSLLVAAS
jgi:uncharacterized protein YhaN